MAGFTNGSLTDAVSHQEVTHPNSVYGSSITPTSGAISAEIHIHHGFIEAGTNTNPASFYIQKNLGVTAENWITAMQFTVTGALVVLENLTATEPVGETVLAVASTTGFVADDYVYVHDVGVPADSEWHQLDVIVSNVSLNLIPAGLVAEKDTSDNVYSDAENFIIPVFDLRSGTPWRVIYKSEGAAAMNTAIFVEYIETTGFA